MSIYKKLEIHSNIRDYAVLFVDNFVHDSPLESGKNYFFIIDQNIKRLYENDLELVLSGYPSMVVEASEAHKTLDYAQVVILHLIENKVRRNCALVAVGGGIIQDITAFVASILYRGVEWIFVPTTLLAQSDSCIGSKTSINVAEYKNQVGNFFPPSSIFLDVHFLNTLSREDIKSGLGEIIKVHFLDGLESLEFIDAHYEESLQNPEVMKELIFRSLKIKKAVIEKDEFDKDYRNIMNYGHTFGHALESLTKYALPHGQAVTIGMDMSNYLSNVFGYITEGLFLRMRNILVKNWPEVSLKELDLSLFFKSLDKDKKNLDNRIAAILTEGPGKMMKKSLVTDDALKAVIQSYFNKYL